MLLGVKDGPNRVRSPRFDPKAILRIFKYPDFRKAAFGYFGHMWELYALWAYIPTLLIAYAQTHDLALNVSLWSFTAIAVGAIACAGGGILSTRFGSAPVAAVLLAISGLCCLLSPLFFSAGLPLFLAFLLLWGLSVSSDSPQFSALNAANAPREFVGSALTIANSIGFLITVVSIQLADALLTLLGARYLFLLLLPGPILGLWAFRPLLRKGR